MSTITIPTADVTLEELSRALRAGLGPRYHVLPGTQAAYAFRTPHPDQPGTIVVGTGSARVWRTEVRIYRRGGQTHIRVAPRNLSPLIWLINTLAISRKVGRVLENATGPAVNR